MAITGSIDHLLEGKDATPIVSNMRLPAALQIGRYSWSQRFSWLFMAWLPSRWVRADSVDRFLGPALDLYAKPFTFQHPADLLRNAEASQFSNPASSFTIFQR